MEYDVKYNIIAVYVNGHEAIVSHEEADRYGEPLVCSTIYEAARQITAMYQMGWPIEQSVAFRIEKAR